MIHNFQLQDFPNSIFRIDTSLWTGRSKLFKDGIQVEQSKEKGKPFLIPTSTGEIIKAYPKASLPEVVPSLEINGTKISILKKLQRYEYIIGGIPFVLIFGGALGAGIGAMGTLLNYKVFRQEETKTIKYLKVAGIILASYLTYFILAVLLVSVLD